MGDELVVQSIRDAPVHHSDAPMHHSGKRERYGRTPDSVLHNTKLTLESRAVYAELARHAFKNGKVYIGARRMAELLGVYQSTVSRRIKELLRAGLIVLTEPSVRGRRAGYQLLSNLFQPREKNLGTKKDHRRVTVRSAARMWAEDCANREVS